MVGSNRRAALGMWRSVPDIALGPVSAAVVPKVRPGTVVLTLDPAAAYANLLFQRDDIEYAVAHPCHPSVFLQRKTQADAELDRVLKQMPHLGHIHR